MDVRSVVVEEDAGNIYGHYDPRSQSPENTRSVYAVSYVEGILVKISGAAVPSEDVRRLGKHGEYGELKSVWGHWLCPGYILLTGWTKILFNLIILFKNLKKETPK